MIIARIVGGLGNQLFIYAAARRLAIRHNEKLVLDLRSGFPRDFYKRTPELHIFDIRCAEAGPIAALEFPGGRLARRALRGASARLGLPGIRLVSDAGADRFLPELLEVQPGRLTILEGLWQSERYFEDVAPILRGDLRIVSEHDPKNLDFAARIRAERAPVAVHTRRLHGVPNVAAAKPVAGARAAPIEYYLAAMRRILEREPAAHFFCFSDYPEWFKENLRVDAPMTIVDINKYGEPRAHEDFWLMTRCRHFVISNSSFSWWAAWLGEAPDKLVIAPDAALWDNRDVIPHAWETIATKRPEAT